MNKLAKVYLGLGSNLGDRLKFLQFGVDSLAREPGQQVCQCSPVYETTPWGVTEQPLYLNAVILIESNAAPIELLRMVKRIEMNAGRSMRAKLWSERELDIDILVFEGVEMQTEKLRLPHSRLLERRFVLQPLSDLAPDLIIPPTNISVQAALHASKDTGDVRLINEALSI